MRSRPAGIDDGDLAADLAGGWGLRVAGLEHVPAGGGSHHWRARDETGGRYWVVVDDLDDKNFLGRTREEVMDGQRRAFESALALREAGLEFVVAPLPTSDGEVVLPLGERWSVALFPYLVGTVYEFGERLGPVERAQLVDMLLRLHAATPSVAGIARPWNPQVAERGVLERALGELDREWTGGPFSEPTRALLAEHADGIRGLLKTFDRLAAETASSEPVVTHGEPHPGNVLGVDGRLLLVDWDTVALAPPERDLWWIDGELERYEAAAGRQVDRAAIDLYRLRWRLDDIANFLRWFRSPHQRTADTERVWPGFSAAVAGSG